MQWLQRAAGAAAALLKLTKAACLSRVLLPQALSAAGEMFKLFNRDSSERVKWLDKGQEHPHRVALQVCMALCSLGVVLVRLAPQEHTLLGLLRMHSGTC
jgi:hypothetical protein